jgi:hypothetical protein
MVNLTPREVDLSPRGMLIDEGFQDGGDLPLLTTRESRGGFE